MNTICRTCGTTLQSGISRDFGQCGACRQTEEYREASRAAEGAKPANDDEDKLRGRKPA